MCTILKASSLGIFFTAALFVAPTYAQQEHQPEISMAEVIVEFDADGDKNISQEEFEKLYQEKIGSEQEDEEEQSISGLFAKLDVDSNEELDSEEMSSDSDFRTQLNQATKVD